VVAVSFSAANFPRSASPVPPAYADNSYIIDYDMAYQPNIGWIYE
jgi:hypothetical protein